MNQFVAPTIMTHLTPELKDKLSNELYPLLHNWYIDNSYYNDVLNDNNINNLMCDENYDLIDCMNSYQYMNEGELILTSIYGIRRYTNGSILRMHVDTANTHVVSAIINVNQENMKEDWPLLILDHDNNEHWISMEPGDLVLYESAKLLHGRPTTMNGDAYDNIFIHYMPEDNTKWEYGFI